MLSSVYSHVSLRWLLPVTVVTLGGCDVQSRDYSDGGAGGASGAVDEFSLGVSGSAGMNSANGNSAGNDATSNDATSNGATSNDATSNDTTSNGTTSNGTASGGAGEGQAGSGGQSTSAGTGATASTDVNLSQGDGESASDSDDAASGKDTLIVIEPGCGNGRLEMDEECDDGAANADGASGACTTVCLLSECGDGESRACSEAGLVGVCAAGSQTCTGGVWGDCDILPAEDDTCATGDDSNCNGVPNEGCGCVAGSVQSCAVSGSLGNCATGEQTCGADGEFSDCSIQPLVEDTCAIVGDDADCDGVPNGGCPCDVGIVIACGPDNETGVCARGASACVDGSPTACEGATLPSARDCASPDDNDCDGFADNLVDDECECVPGESRGCEEHAGLDGNGQCAAGMQICVASSDGSSSTWAGCLGSVGPASSDSCQTQNDDSDCDGQANSGCECVAGEQKACADLYGSLGVCSSITLVCGATGKWPSDVNCSPSSAEVCDSSERDEDCDGESNEDGVCGCTAAVWNAWSWGEDVCWQ